MKRFVAVAAASAVAVLALSSGASSMQWFSKGEGSIPRTADGKPDFSGVWQAMNTANWDIEPHHARPGTPPGLGIVVDGPLPYRADALAQRKANWKGREKEDVDAKCFPPGAPQPH